MDYSTLQDKPGPTIKVTKVKLKTVRKGITILLTIPCFVPCSLFMDVALYNRTTVREW